MQDLQRSMTRPWKRQIQEKEDTLFDTLWSGFLIVIKIKKKEHIWIEENISFFKEIDLIYLASRP